MADRAYNRSAEPPMTRTIIMKGRLTSPTTIELELPLPEHTREVQVIAQIAADSSDRLSDYLRSLPPDPAPRTISSGRSARSAIPGGEYSRAVMATTAKPNYAHIVKEPGYCGGKAPIGSTRVRVKNIVFLHKQGKTPDQILIEYPDLTLAQVTARSPTTTTIRTRSSPSWRRWRDRTSATNGAKA